MLKRKAEPGQISKRNSNGGNHCFISKMLSLFGLKQWLRWVIDDISNLQLHFMTVELMTLEDESMTCEMMTENNDMSHN